MCDGDILLVVEDKDFIKLAEKNMKNIVPLYYEMKKAFALLFFVPATQTSML